MCRGAGDATLPVPLPISCWHRSCHATAHCARPALPVPFSSPQAEERMRRAEEYLGQLEGKQASMQRQAEGMAAELADLEASAVQVGQGGAGDTGRWGRIDSRLGGLGTAMPRVGVSCQQGSQAGFKAGAMCEME